MKQVRKINYITSIFLLFIFACESRQDIEVNELAKVYVDLLVVEDYYSNTNSLTIKRDSVFEKYNINEALFDSTFKNFTHDREKWDNFFKLANEYLDTLKANLKIEPPKRPPERS